MHSVCGYKIGGHAVGSHGAGGYWGNLLIAGLFKNACMW